MSASYPVKIKRQNRKSMSMRLTYDGVVVCIPHWMKPNDKRVKAFIEDGLRKVGDLQLPERVEQITREQIRAMVVEWSLRMGVAPNRVGFRKMTSRWGSCSSTGRISLNSALCFVPAPLAEYVVVHELVHLHVFNHGAEFKALMTHYLPDWQSRQAELRRIPL